jgi:hypothetical protein
VNPNSFVNEVRYMVSLLLEQATIHFHHVGLKREENASKLNLCNCKCSELRADVLFGL